jgi:hypothetical protein
MNQLLLNSIQGIGLKCAYINAYINAYITTKEKKMN